MEFLSKAKIKWVKSLHHKKTRDVEKCFIVEGEKMVKEGLEYFSDYLLHLFVLSTSFEDVPKEFLEQTLVVNNKELEQLSELKTPNKFVAIFRKPAQVEYNENFALVLDGIQDPGNMGTLLRLADWFGVETIICSTDTVDIYNPKVVQASMGAIFRIDVIYTNLLSFLENTKQPKYGALLNGQPYKSVSYEKNGLLIMGNEGNGIRPEIESLIDYKVTIPRFGNAESLNVGTATAILLAEIIH